MLAIAGVKPLRSTKSALSMARSARIRGRWITSTRRFRLFELWVIVPERPMRSTDSASSMAPSAPGEKALDCHNQALPFARAVGDRQSEAIALFGIARIEDADDKPLDARHTIESALNIVESLRTKVVSPELRSSYFESARKYYEFGIDLLMRLHKLHPNGGCEILGGSGALEPDDSRPGNIRAERQAPGDRS